MKAFEKCNQDVMEVFLRAGVMHRAVLEGLQHDPLIHQNLCDQFIVYFDQEVNISQHFPLHERGK